MIHVFTVHNTRHWRRRIVPMRKSLFALGALIASCLALPVPAHAVANITLPTVLGNTVPGSGGPNIPLVPKTLIFGVTCTGCQSISFVTVDSDGSMHMKV